MTVFIADFEVLTFASDVPIEIFEMSERTVTLRKVAIKSLRIEQFFCGVLSLMASNRCSMVSTSRHQHTCHCICVGVNILKASICRGSATLSLASAMNVVVI